MHRDNLRSEKAEIKEVREGQNTYTDQVHQSKHREGQSESEQVKSLSERIEQVYRRL